MLGATKIIDRQSLPDGAVDSTRDQQAIISYAAYVKPLPCGAVFGTPVWTLGREQKSETPYLEQSSKGPNKRLAGVMITRVQNPNFRLTEHVPSTIAIAGLITVAENTGKHVIREGDVVLCLPGDKFGQWHMRSNLKSICGDERGITVPLRIFNRHDDGGATVAWSKATLKMSQTTTNRAAGFEEEVNRAARLLLEFEHSGEALTKWNDYEETDEGLKKLKAKLVDIWSRASATMSNYRLGIAQQHAKPGKQFSLLLTINEYHANHV
jgi:hypothetical protein